MTSKYGELLKGARARSGGDDRPAAETPGPAGSPAATAPGPPLDRPPAPPRRGRPPGKRSDPGFVQVTAYVPGDLYRRVRIGLLEDAKGQEFSELVAELLVDWVNSRD